MGFFNTEYSSKWEFLQLNFTKIYLIIACIALTLFVTTDMSNPSGVYSILNTMNNKIIEMEKSHNQKMHIIQTTNDCILLQGKALELISDGRDSSKLLFKDKWDKMLGIAEKRYDLLC